MLYIRCPTCGFFLGQITINYETEKKKICNNPNLIEEQKEDEISKLLKSLNLKRPCCKMRIMTGKDMSDIINK